MINFGTNRTALHSGRLAYKISLYYAKDKFSDKVVLLDTIGPRSLAIKLGSVVFTISNKALD